MKRRLRGTACFVVAAALAFQASFAVAQIPGLPNLPGLPRLPSLPSAPISPGSPDGSDGSGVAVLGICALVGAGGAALGKKLAAKEASRLSLSSAQRRQREQGYMLGFALMGCAVGGSVAARVIKNMSESSKKAQEQAWHQAQQQTGPVAWQDPNSRTRGTTEIVEREPMPDGGECGTRRDVIEAEEGTAEPMVRVCRTAGTAGWSPVVS